MLTPSSGSHVVRIAVASAELAMGERLVGLLTREDTTVACHATLRELHEFGRPDLIALDRRVLSDDYAELRRVRCRWSTVQLVLLAAHDDRDSIHLLDAGADDAMSLEHPAFASRLHAATRRARTLRTGRIASVADVQYDAASGRVRCAGHDLDLTPTELALFVCLISVAPSVVTMLEMAAVVWDGHMDRRRHALIRVYIGYLREKLRDSRAARICTIRGVGYSLTDLRHSPPVCEVRRSVRVRSGP